MDIIYFGIYNKVYLIITKVVQFTREGKYML